MAQTFYSACTGVAFALLGLWWVVVTHRYEEWENQRARRRQAYTVSLYFMIPAIMSLVSLIAPGQTAIWRVGFALSGAIGLAETVLALVETMRDRARGRVRAFVAATIPLYIVVIAVAIRPQLLHDLSVSLTPLETEALSVSLLLFVGVNFAWAVFFERIEDQQAQA